MPDQDLSTDDLKYVSYAILFTKRDYEVTLQQDTEELVDYPTDGGSYGGLKIARFMQAAAYNKANSARKVLKDKGYDDIVTVPETGGWTISPGDERYVKFIYEVRTRIPREGAEYDRQKVKALKGIEKGIG